MRVIFISILIIYIFTNFIKEFDTRNKVNISLECNKKAFIITKNIEMFKCINMNKTCNNLDNFTNYQKIRNDCIINKKKINYELYISLIILILLNKYFN